MSNLRPTYKHIISVLEDLDNKSEDTSIDNLVAILPYRKKDTLAYIAHLAAYDYIYPDSERKFHVSDKYKRNSSDQRGMQE